MAAITDRYDVIVVGGGNAAMCAALSTREQGASVLVVERAPESERGGNSAYTDGTLRFVYNGADDIIALSPDLTPQEIAATDFGAYTEAQFFDDMARITQNRTDPDLCEILVKNSNAALRWLKTQGVTFMPNYGRQAYRIEGRFKFWGGVTLIIRGGGRELIDTLYKTAQSKGIDIVYNAWVKELIHSDLGVSGVIATIEGTTRRIGARAVILACGGFEANTEWRSRYLGPGWDLAKVRGTKYNTGDGLAMALKIGAQSFGHWSGCHAASWERHATDFGDLSLTPNFQRHSYPFSVMINAEGRRFLDEGAEFRNYTYAKYGRMVLQQPGQFAWQVYDSKTTQLLLAEYRTKHVTKVKADTLEELAEKMGDVNREQFLKTIREFNAAVKKDAPFNPNNKDGKCTVGLEIPKSNWAQPIDEPPFEAYGVTCGVTFTFGGLKITHEAQVVDTQHHPIPGLFAAGEMVGGIFYFNYPGASGLTSGTVFGRLAGRSAGRFAKEHGRA
ncbi:MAG: FAD-dependent tricarballylate dehydrogenase TcuA [Betaproteobacteria bacterium]|nr:FAD-dependent tricarballylate dehydrogenase TcuA [Betaproteobacteria bacterium]